MKIVWSGERTGTVKNIITVSDCEDNEERKKSLFMVGEKLLLAKEKGSDKSSRRRRSGQWSRAEKQEQFGSCLGCLCVRVCVLMPPSLQTTLWKIIARGVSFAVLEKETREEGKIHPLFCGKLFKRVCKVAPFSASNCLARDARLRWQKRKCWLTVRFSKNGWFWQVGFDVDDGSRSVWKVDVIF